MATLDIRPDADDKIDRIQFDDDSFLTNDVGMYYIQTGDDKHYIPVNEESLDNLIIAIQKAKELWFSKR